MQDNNLYNKSQGEQGLIYCTREAIKLNFNKPPHQATRMCG